MMTCYYMATGRFLNIVSGNLDDMAQVSGAVIDIASSY